VTLGVNLAGCSRTRASVSVSNSAQFPRLLDAGLINPPLSFVACSGATTKDVINGKAGVPSQYNALFSW
jgi:hypothetical protein